MSEIVKVSTSKLATNLFISSLFRGINYNELRALAEEKLLAADPDYVAYGLWMDKHGIFRKLGEICPVFSFGWRLEHWRKTGALARQNG